MPSPRDARAGRADVELGIRSKLEAGLKRAGNQLRSFGAGVAQVGGILTAAGGAIVAPLIAASASFAAAGDSLQKMSQRTRIAAEELSALSFAAASSGTDLDQLAAAVFRMNRRLANAQTETGPAVRALTELGLSVKQITQLSPDQQLRVLADALNNVSDKGRAAQLGFELFGDNFRQIKPLLDQGSAGINQLTAEARALGITMSNEDAEAAAELTDAMGRLKSQFSAIKNQIGAALAPALSNLLGMVKPLIASGLEWLKQNRGLVVTLAAVGASLAGVGTVVVGVGGAIATLGAIIAGVGTALGAMATAGTAALAFLLSPIGAVVAGVTLLSGAVLAGGAAWLAFTDSGRAAVSGFLGLLAPMIKTIRSAMSGIVDALSGGNVRLAGQIMFAGLGSVFAQGANTIISLMRRMVSGIFNVLGKLPLGVGELFDKLEATFDRTVGLRLDGLQSGLDGIVNVADNKLTELNRLAKQKRAEQQKETEPISLDIEDFQLPDDHFDQAGADLEKQLHEQLAEAMKSAPIPEDLLQDRFELGSQPVQGAIESAADQSRNVAAGTFQSQQALQFVRTDSASDQRALDAAENTAANTAEIAAHLAGDAGTFA